MVKDTEGTMDKAIKNMHHVTFSLNQQAQMPVMNNPTTDDRESLDWTATAPGLESTGNSASFADQLATTQSNSVQPGANESLSNDCLDNWYRLHEVNTQVWCIC